MITPALLAFKAITTLVILAGTFYYAYRRGVRAGANGAMYFMEVGLKETLKRMAPEHQDAFMEAMGKEAEKTKQLWEQRGKPL